MKYEYAATENGILTDAQAVVVGKALTKIEKQKGCVAPRYVVDEGRDSSSELHQFFTWDQAKAAELHRLEEARRLIRSVSIIQISRPQSQPKVVRAFVSVHSSEREKRFEGRAYISTVKALSDADYKAQVLQEALQEFTSLRKKYENLKELADIFAAIEATEERLVEA